MKKKDLAKLIDHTLLGPAATRDGVRKLCAEAKESGFASVCVSPCYTALAADLLRGTGVKVCVTIGFPHGTQKSEVKACEAKQAIADGAEELDMVAPVAALKEKDDERYLKDVRAVCAAAVKAPRPVIVKVILETALLTAEEKVAGATLAQAAGAQFVKTSTGYGPGGATVEDVRLLKEAVTGKCRVKAAGGIRDLSALYRMVEAGADRIGTSSGVAIVEEFLRERR